MRGGDGVRGGDGGAGGAGGVTNASLVAYTGIAPSTAINLQQEADFRARNFGGEKIIATYADLEFHFPASGGVHTVNVGARLTATIFMPPGFRILVAGGYIAGTFGVKNAIIGDVAAPLVSGDPLLLEAIAIIPTNPAGTAIDGTSTSGAATILRNVVISSPISPTPLCGAGSIHDLTAGGALVIEAIQIDAMTSGLMLDGLMAAARVFQTTVTNMAPGAKAYTIGPTAIITVAIGISSGVFVTSDAGQRMVRIDPGATLPNPAATVPTNIVGCRVEDNSMAFGGALGKVMDETGIAESDIRVLSIGNLYGRRSEFSGLATFSSSTPITKTYGGTTFEPIPFSNGAGTNLTLDPVSQRFTLITGPGATDWYLRFNGPLEGLSMRVHASLSIEAVSTASTLRVRLESRLGTGGIWVAVPGSASRMRQVNGEPRHIDVEGTVTADPDYQFRITIANDNAAASTRITEISVDAEGRV